MYSNSLQKSNKGMRRNHSDLYNNPEIVFGNVPPLLIQYAAPSPVSHARISPISEAEKDTQEATYGRQVYGADSQGLRLDSNTASQKGSGTDHLRGQGYSQAQDAQSQQQDRTFRPPSWATHQAQPSILPFRAPAHRSQDVMAHPPDPSINPQSPPESVNYAQNSTSSATANPSQKPVGAFYLPASHPQETEARRYQVPPSFADRHAPPHLTDARRSLMASSHGSSLREPSPQVMHKEHTRSSAFGSSGHNNQQYHIGSRQVTRSPVDARSTSAPHDPRQSGAQSPYPSPEDGSYTAGALKTLFPKFHLSSSSTGQRQDPVQQHGYEVEDRSSQHWPSLSNREGGYKEDRRSGRFTLPEPGFSGSFSGPGVSGSSSNQPSGLSWDRDAAHQYPDDQDGQRQFDGSMSASRYGPKAVRDSEMNVDQQATVGDRMATKDDSSEPHDVDGDSHVKNAQEQEQEQEHFAMPSSVRAHTVVAEGLARESIFRAALENTRTMSDDGSWKLATDASKKQRDTLRSAHIFFESLRNNYEQLVIVNENERKRKVALTERYGAAVANLWDQCGDVQKATRSNAKKRRLGG